MSVICICLCYYHKCYKYMQTDMVHYYLFIFNKKSYSLFILHLESRSLTSWSFSKILLLKEQQHKTVSQRIAQYCADEDYMFGLCFCVNYAANNVKPLPISALWVARSPWSIEEHINRTWKGFPVIRPSDILSRIMGKGRELEVGGGWGGAFAETEARFPSAFTLCSATCNYLRRIV